MDEKEPKAMTDRQVLDALRAAAAKEQVEAIFLLKLLIEMDQRDIHGAEAYPSLYEFCVRDLRYSEATAYHRIRAARAARKYPRIFEMLAKGEISLESVVRLNPHLTKESAPGLLEQARGKTRREVEALVADMPQPPQPDFIRAVGRRIEPSPGRPEDAPLFPSPSPPGAGTGAGDSLVRFRFDADEELRELVERAREILRHRFPSGRLEQLFKYALKLVLKSLDPSWRSKPAPERPSSGRRREVPQWVKDRVWARDGGRCVFVSEGGQLCGSADGLEYHHVTPWALGGASDDPGNIRLHCRTHNRLEAKRLGLLSDDSR